MQNKVQTIDKRATGARDCKSRARLLSRASLRAYRRAEMSSFLPRRRPPAPAAHHNRTSLSSLHESLESARYLPALPGVPILELADEQYPEEEGFEGDVKSPPGPPSPQGPD